jgi:hypothetical protein
MYAIRKKKQMGLLSESRTCAIEFMTCGYLSLGSSPDESLEVDGMFRARVWDAHDGRYAGDSLGWTDPSEGFPPTDPTAPTLDALKTMRSANPTRECNPTSPNPLVIVPGLTSSNINYELTNSPPPADAFW